MDVLSMRKQMSRKEYINSTKTKTKPSSTTPARVFDIHDHDVLLGRGGKNNQHSGNELLRQIAKRHAIRYNDAQKKEKTAITREIVYQMFQLRPPARFLKRVDDYWEEVSENTAREKVSQVLRDAIAALENEGSSINFISLSTQHDTSPLAAVPSLHDRYQQDTTFTSTFQQPDRIKYSPYHSPPQPYYNESGVRPPPQIPLPIQYHQQSYPEYYDVHTPIHNHYRNYRYPTNQAFPPYHQHCTMLPTYSQPQQENFNERKRPWHRSSFVDRNDRSAISETECERYFTDFRPDPAEPPNYRDRPPMATTSYVNYVTPGWSETASRYSSGDLVDDQQLSSFDLPPQVPTTTSTTTTTGYDRTPTNTPPREGRRGGGISLNSIDMELILGELVQSPTPVYPGVDIFDEDSHGST